MPLARILRKPDRLGRLVVVALAAPGLTAATSESTRATPAPAHPRAGQGKEKRPSPRPGRSRRAPALPPPQLLIGGRFVRARNGLLANIQFRARASTLPIERYFRSSASVSRAQGWRRIDSRGLHLGVLASRPGRWVGFYAEPRGVYPASSIFHVHAYPSSRPVGGRDQAGEAAFAVHTGSTKPTAAVSYAFVASSSTAGMSRWEVGYGQGQRSRVTTRILWQSPLVRGAARDENITLRTDGQSRLEVYFGQRRVYATQRLRLRIEQPLQPRLQIQGLRLGYNARFTDFWVAGGSWVTLSGLPVGARVAFSPAGAGTLHATASREGRVRLALAPAHVRGLARVTIAHGRRERRIDRVSYAGGDVLRLEVPGLTAMRSAPSGSGRLWVGVGVGGLAVLALMMGALVARRPLRIVVTQRPTARGHGVAVSITNRLRRSVHIEQVFLRELGQLQIEAGKYPPSVVPHYLERTLAGREGPVTEVFVVPAEWVTRARRFRALVALRQRGRPLRSSRHRVGCAEEVPPASPPRPSEAATPIGAAPPA